MDRIENLSPDYKRPPGFTLLPTLLTASMQNKSLDKRRHHNHTERVQQQQQEQPSKPSNKFASVVSKFNSKSSQADVSSQMIRHRPQSKNEMLRYVDQKYHNIFTILNGHKIHVALTNMSFFPLLLMLITISFQMLHTFYSLFICQIN